MSIDEAATLARAGTSFALAPAFRGRFCAALSLNRAARTFEKGEVLFDLGDTERTLFLIRRGVVKTGTTTDLGREIIYDLRKDGDVVGELCGEDAPKKKGSIWVLEVEGTGVTPARYLAPPG